MAFDRKAVAVVKPVVDIDEELLEDGAGLEE